MVNILSLLLLNSIGQTGGLPSGITQVNMMPVTIIYFKHRLCPYFLKFLLETIVLFAFEDGDFNVFWWDGLVRGHHVLFVKRVLIKQSVMPGSILSPAFLHCFNVEILLSVQVSDAFAVDFLVLSVVVLVEYSNADVPRDGARALIFITNFDRQHLQITGELMHGLMARNRRSLRGSGHLFDKMQVRALLLLFFNNRIALHRPPILPSLDK